MSPGRLAVVGAGWAGLAAAVRARQAGWDVTLHEMSARPGGRARTLAPGDGLPAGLDNGQHILIGAYRATLALMQEVGVDVQAVLQRSPLQLRHADGRGLALTAGATLPALLRGILGCRGWTTADRWSLLSHALRWQVGGFRCAPDRTVEALCSGMRPAVRSLLVDPLCVAALNTPAREASAAVFLRVLRDALFGAPGGADLLLPRRPLDELFPQPAVRWLEARGAALHWRSRVHCVQRVQRASPESVAWSVDGQVFDRVILACPAGEAARLVAQENPAWSARARAMPQEPIVTVYLRNPGVRLPAPIVALQDDAASPAQFVFDRGALGLADGLLACVVSGARHWVDAGLGATAAAVQRQLQQAFPAAPWRQALEIVHTVAEKRATFRCVPGLQRPSCRIADGLHAAGDYVDGPYPATLEGAVLSAQVALDGF